MLRKPKAKILTEAEVAVITSASAQQTGKVQTQKTYDPAFPVFDIPINQKLLVYIPNHTVVQPDGSIDLRMDKFAAHPVIDGRSYGNVRCSQGIIVDSLGLDGTCPLCNASSHVWDLYHKEYASVAKAKGIAIDAPEATEALKEDRRKLAQDMSIKSAEVWYTFPIVVIECEEKDGQLTTTPKKTADGQIVGEPYFYSIREKTFEDKWMPAFDTIESDDDSPLHAGGRWAVLNFTYKPQSGQHTKMGSANALKVSFKSMSADFKAWEEYFDKMTESWTPQKAQEVVVLDVVRDMDEMNEVADQLLKPVLSKLAMYDLADGKVAVPAASAVGDAQSVLASFGSMPVENTGDVLVETSSGVQ